MRNSLSVTGVLTYKRVLVFGPRPIKELPPPSMPKRYSTSSPNNFACYGPTKQGLRLASICAEQAAFGNVVEYVETRDANGLVYADATIRNPMGF